MACLNWIYGNSQWGEPDEVYMAHLCNEHAALYLQPMYSYVRKGATTEKCCQLCQLSEHLEKEAMAKLNRIQLLKQVELQLQVSDQSPN